MARGNYQRKRRYGWLIIILSLLLLTALLWFDAHPLELGGKNPTDSSTAASTTAPTTQPPTAPPTEPTTEPTTVPTEPFVISTASIGVTGDMLIHSPIYQAAHKGNGVYDFSEIFTYISGYYKRYDFMVANLEVPLAGAERGYSGYPNFNCPDGIVDALKDAGVDMVLSANNHTYDQGHSGFVRTQEVLQEKEMAYLGTRLSMEEPPYIVRDINGIKVGMVCYTYETGNTSDGRKTLNGIGVSANDCALISSFHPKHLDDQFFPQVEETLKAMYADGAEVTMVYIHWGEEYQLQQNSQQAYIAKNLCELGVDVIVGGHPHVIQPFETLTSSTGHQTYCIYSVGNAVSNQRRKVITQDEYGHTEDGMIFGVTFEKWNDGSVNVAAIDVLPTWVFRDLYSAKHRIYQIIPLDLSVEDWSGYPFSDSYLYSSYKRTMEIVGKGLNDYRQSVGLAEVPLTAKD